MGHAMQCHTQAYRHVRAPSLVGAWAVGRGPCHHCVTAAKQAEIERHREMLIEREREREEGWGGMKC